MSILTRWRDRSARRALARAADLARRDQRTLRAMAELDLARRAEEGEGMITVLVRDRDAETFLRGTPITREITISASCPRCGQRRGTPELVTGKTRRGQHYHVHTWNNPCGHSDTTAGAITEADLLALGAATSVYSGIGGTHR